MHFKKDETIKQKNKSIIHHQKYVIDQKISLLMVRTILVLKIVICVTGQK